MEGRLRSLPGDHALMPLCEPRLFRSAAIAADLQVLLGAAWRELPIIPAARDYAGRVASLSGAETLRVAGHCYTRYLGDLNGGRILERLLAARLGLPPSALSCYAFDLPGGTARFRSSYVNALNAIARDCNEAAAVVDEAVRAFHMNIAVSRELLEFLDQCRPVSSRVGGTS
jgi:heme oxygenase (biliverdin-producing, ferredoxin)